MLFLAHLIDPSKNLHPLSKGHISLQFVCALFSLKLLNSFRLLSLESLLHSVSLNAASVVSRFRENFCIEGPLKRLRIWFTKTRRKPQENMQNCNFLKPFLLLLYRYYFFS